MKNKSGKTYELRNRILFTLGVLVVFMAGKGILLYGIDASDITGRDAQEIMLSMLRGDRYQQTVMALGIMPYINASIIVQVIASVRTADARARLSHHTLDRWIGWLTFAMAAAFAIYQAEHFAYRADAGNLSLVKIIVVAQMTGGAMAIYFLCLENTKHGIGASLPPILLNILDSAYEHVRIYSVSEYWMIWLLCGIAGIVTLIMENVTVKIPVQRVSVHNLHADKNYIAYKLNPIGVMPVMFATAVMAIPQLIFSGLSSIMPENEWMRYIAANLRTTQRLGIIVYLVILFVITIAFSFIMLSPGDTARQLQRNGDSIVDVYAGRKTIRYLSFRLFVLGLISAAVQCVVMGISLQMSFRQVIPSEFAMMPATAMVLVSMICSLAREIHVYYLYDTYRFIF